MLIVHFSNAVFHWIKNHDLLLQNIYSALKPRGILVCEFGANGNIIAIENVFVNVCKEMGHNLSRRNDYNEYRNI